MGILVLSVLLVLWAGTRPGFDPYGWLSWGHQTRAGNLDTNAAPSWKPLPYLFTTVFAFAGHYEMRLWMITSAAISLAGVVFAGRIAYKLTGDSPARRWAPWVAGAFAGLALLGLRDENGASYFHYILSSQSDPMIVTFCLAAIDCHLDDRPRTAFVMGCLAALGRPEVWPFLGLYTIWLWRERPAHPPAAGDRGRRDGAVVVRDPRAHLPLVVRRRRQRQPLGPRALGQPHHGGHPPLRRPAPLAAGAGGAAGRGPGRAAARPNPARARRGDRRVGDRRDRLRTPRLARPGALHVRGGRGDGRPRRGGRGPAARRGAGRARGRCRPGRPGAWWRCSSSR